MLRPAHIAQCCLLASLLLASCRSPVPVWNEDGRTMTDLRTLRHHAKQSIELARGVRLYADDIRYTDKKERSGEAIGHVLLDVEPAVRYEWMLEHGYAGKARFDRRACFVELAGHPMLEREMMTQIATEPYTTIEVRWDSRIAQVIVRGPTRTDFAKSHPVPSGVVLPNAPLPPEPVRKTLPARGFSKH